MGSPVFSQRNRLHSWGEWSFQAALGSFAGVFGVDQSFDYVVVGGGTAGNAIGVRLAKAGFKVAIIEAGEYHELSKPIFSTVPGFDLFFIGSNVLETYLPADWGFVTEAMLGTNQRKIKYTQGKCVGGSSAVNAMLYHRGPGSMYDLWAEAVGDDSYRFDQFDEFYKKSVTFDPPGKADEINDESYYEDDFAPNRQDTEVTQITFDDQKRATGVNVKAFGSKYHIKAKGETIISASAFKSPQLLMLSGIGPRTTLQQFGLPIVSELEGVGVKTFDQLIHDPAYAAASAAEYTLLHSGPLSSNAVGLLAWEKIPQQYRDVFSRDTTNKLNSYSADWPEVEHLAIDGFTGDFQSLILQQPLAFRSYATLQSALVAPFSRGNVTIRSSSAMDAPVISPNWLEDKADQEVAIVLFKRMREIMSTDVIQNTAVGKEYWPGSKVQTDDEILNYIRGSLMTVWHASCTYKMGTASDGMAVVDSAARVFGVQRLRVVDASAFPLLIPGHPSSTVYALAEKIADNIIRNSGT
ncbi:hypothetical protein NLG97_g2355 [Lecanicillium saksenae]|uniref:Uncharacterized protein n=1 Tax=Lecanicillium saksenae TaxID=468837 RepID=A0ACC1R2E5_9HYPO|nr:hypothetical protein NLG97_g2355 [Lecanicillium saksenae]